MQKAIICSLFLVFSLLSGCGDSSPAAGGPVGKEKVRPLQKFTEALESAGITVVRTETAESHFPDSSGTRYLMYVNSDSKIEPGEELIEVYHFETIEEARSVFPEEGVEIQGQHQNIERNGNLVLFTYDNLTLWDQVYLVWSRM